MREEGITLPSELVLPGALGDALDKNWMYIDKLQKWDEWEIELQKRFPIVYKSQLGTTVQYVDWVESMKGYVTVEPVHYRDVEVLSKTLQLPEGWESHTIMDESYPLSERVNHMRASFAYLRKSPLDNVLMDLEMDITTKNLEDTSREKESVSTIIDDNKKVTPYHTSLLAPFFRNVWLGRLRDQRSEKLQFPIFIAKVDILALRSYLEPYVDAAEDDEFTSPGLGVLNTMFLCNTIMWTAPDPINSIGFELTIYNDGIGFDKNYNASHSADSKIVSKLYTKLLQFIPLDVSPLDIGLEYIINEKRERIERQYDPLEGLTRFERRLTSAQIRSRGNSTETYILINKTVGWVNSNLISLRLSGVTFDTIVITKKQFPRVISILASTIGIYAMRRMLISLLHSLENHKYNKDSLDRVESFSDMLENYLAEHEEDDDGVITLQIQPK
jgi:hypothetical protein